MNERLTITFATDGDYADARVFNAVFQDVLDMLDSLARERYKTDSKISWKIVAVAKNSPMKIEIESSTKRKLGTVLLTGLMTIQTTAKAAFGNGTTRIAQRFARRIEGHRVTEMMIESENKTFRPNAELAANAESILGGSHYELPSSVDGVLEIVNVHGSAKFSIFDDTQGREIKCKFKDAIFDTVKDNLGKRVTANGMVKYSRNTDRPVSILVDSVEPLGGDEIPNSFDDMPAIDLTDETISPEQYIRELRNGR